MARKVSIHHDRRKKVLLAGIALLILLGGLMVYFAGGTPEETKIVPMELQVGNRVAFNLDPDALRFGSTTPGGGAERILEVKNQKPYPIRVEIYASGNISMWLRAFDNRFPLEPFSARNITLNVDIPGGAAHGNYTGTLLLVSLRRWI